MSQSDIIIFAVCLLGFAVIGYIIFGLAKQKGGNGNYNDEDGGQGGEQQRPRGNLRRRRGGGGGEANNAVGDDAHDEDNDEEVNEPDLSGMTKKEMAKVEKRRVKAQQREAMEAEREERKEKEEARMEMLRERELQKEEDFRVKEEARQRALAVEEQRLRDAYNHWKDPCPDAILNFPSAIAEKTSDEGAVEIRSESFVAFVKDAKAVSLDELSEHFRLPSVNCIEILRHLTARGDLCGVFVEDNRFVCIGDSTVEKVKSFVQEHGSLSSADVANLVL